MLLARLNRWTKARLRHLRDERRGRMIVLESGLEIHQGSRVSFVPWLRLVRITATRNDAFIGDVIGLSIESADGQSAHASEHDPEWQALVDGLSAHLPGSVPYARWALELVAGNRASFPVYRAHEERGTSYP